MMEGGKEELGGEGEGGEGGRRGGRGGGGISKFGLFYEQVRNQRTQEHE